MPLKNAPPHRPDGFAQSPADLFGSDVSARGSRPEGQPSRSGNGHRWGTRYADAAHPPARDSVRRSVASNGRFDVIREHGGPRAAVRLLSDVDRKPVRVPDESLGQHDRRSGRRRLRHHHRTERRRRDAPANGRPAGADRSATDADIYAPNGSCRPAAATSSRHP